MQPRLSISSLPELSRKTHNAATLTAHILVILNTRILAIQMTTLAGIGDRKILAT